jgi:hypothetical protein
MPPHFGFRKSRRSSGRAELEVLLGVALPATKTEKSKKPKTKGEFPIRLPLASVHGPGRWVVRIDRWTPHKLNELLKMHWAARGRAKEADALVVAGALRDAGVTAALGKRRLSITIILAKYQRAADPDAYHKSPVDGAVRCGALRNDNRQWLDLPPVQFDDKSRPTWEATIITLEDC